MMSAAETLAKFGAAASAFLANLARRCMALRSGQCFAGRLSYSRRYQRISQIGILFGSFSRTGPPAWRFPDIPQPLRVPLPIGAGLISQVRNGRNYRR